MVKITNLFLQCRKHTCMKCGTHFATCGRGVKFCTLSSKKEPSQEMDLCLMVFASPNVKVHGILTMLSPIKPGKLQ